MPDRIVAASAPQCTAPVEQMLIVPGLGGSGPAHWQTVWERADPTARRLAPASWDAPLLADWVAALDRAAAAMRGPVAVVAHSLGCVAVALLVAPPDVERTGIDPRVRGFAPLPAAALPFPALLVASRDDPYCTLPRARDLAARWGAGFRDAGACGHLNADSGLGDWAAGRDLLAAVPR